MSGGVPILEVALRLGVKFKSGGGVERCGPCPACGGDDRFSVNTAKGVFNCRGCGVGGDTIALARHVAGISYAEALAFVGDERAYAPAPRNRAGACWQAPSAGANERNPDPEKIARALALWHEADDPRGTVAERYLNTRSLALDLAIAGYVLRWHPGAGAMLALFRDALTAEPRALSRTFLSPDARKIGRKFLGPVGGAAIRLDEPTNELTVCEGIETAMTARALGYGPTWAIGSAGAVAALPIIPGVTRLRICVERDENGASERAAIACAARWEAAGSKVGFRLPPPRCNDINDAIRQDAR